MPNFMSERPVVLEELKHIHRHKIVLYGIDQCFSSGSTFQPEVTFHYLHLRGVI